MARRVIEGQIGMFDEGEGRTTEVVPHWTRTSSVNAFGVATFPIGEGVGGRETPARVLTLAEIEGLEPFRTEGLCTGDDCALWNDDLDTCGLSPASLQLLMKTAVCDAAAEIMRVVGDDLR